LDCWRWFKEALGSGVYKDPPQGQTLLPDFLAFCFVHPAQTLLHSTPQLVARDRRAIAHLEHRAAPTGPGPPKTTRNFHSTLLRLTRAARWPYISGQKKAGLNFLFILIGSAYGS
jgi:hypothetical protein